MNSLLFGISLSALLSITSLLVVVLRVSPLTAGVPAVVALIVSLFLSISSTGTIVLILLLRSLPHHSWDMGKVTSIALREGIFLGLAVSIILLLHLGGIFTWWAGVVVVGIFGLLEAALLS